MFNSKPRNAFASAVSLSHLSPYGTEFLCCYAQPGSLCMLQKRLDGLPEGSFLLQDSSQPCPARGQLHNLERQSLLAQSQKLAQAEAALRAEQRQCNALREQAEQSQGYAIQAQLQLRRAHSRAERLAALVIEADQERKGYNECFCADRTCITICFFHDALLMPYIS